MKTIKIASLLYNENNIDRIQQILRIDAEKHNLKFIYDESTPDYVLATNSIYDSKNLYKKLLRYINLDCIIIFFAGECVTPDMNIFDYAIAFDRNLHFEDRIARLSTCRFYSVSIFEEYLKIDINNEYIDKKKKFCNFMYSHSFPIRDDIFRKLCEYKKVDSIGKHLNNTGVKSTRYSDNWRKISIEDRLPYKFSIAAENASFPGYTSEKIISCFQAHTVPIYWGDPTITDEFNPKAFINCNDYNTLDEVLKKVVEIDNDDELYISMLREPWQTEEQREKTIEMDKKYDEWILNIFNQPKELARRRPWGTYPNAYKRWFIQRYKRDLITILKKQCARVLNILKLRKM